MYKLGGFADGVGSERTAAGRRNAILDRALRLIGGVMIMEAFCLGVYILE